MRASDAALIAELRQGDIQAFAKLVDARYASVFAVALAITGDTDAAEDLTQSTFVDAHARIGELRDAARFAPWLHAIARNKSRDWVRRRSRAPALVGDPSELRDDPHAAVVDTTRDEAIRQAVRSLPEAYREIVLLRFVGGLDHATIAKTLRISVSAVKMRWHRARKMLQARLSDWAPPALSRVEDELQTR